MKYVKHIFITNENWIILERRCGGDFAYFEWLDTPEEDGVVKHHHLPNFLGYDLLFQIEYQF